MSRIRNEPWVRAPPARFRRGRLICHKKDKQKNGVAVQDLSRLDRLYMQERRQNKKNKKTNVVAVQDLSRLDCPAVNIGAPDKQK